MSEIPATMQQLRGLDYETASKFGMPHIMCHYDRDDTNSNRLDEGAQCVICGSRATNSHHDPAKGMGGKNRQFVLCTPVGQFVLKPALIAVCGSGTTGCHGNFHGGSVYTSRWVWENEDYGKLWWDGYWLSHGIEPHSPVLYELGHWEITDKRDQSIIIYRGQNRM